MGASSGGEDELPRSTGGEEDPGDQKAGRWLGGCRDGFELRDSGEPGFWISPASCWTFSFDLVDM